VMGSMRRRRVCSVLADASQRGMLRRVHGRWRELGEVLGGYRRERETGHEVRRDHEVVDVVHRVLIFAGLGGLDRGHAGRSHLAGLDAALGAVLLGPCPWLRAPSSDELHGPLCVDLASDAVNPAVGHQQVEHLVAGDVVERHSLLEGDEPDRLVLVVVRFEPCSELGR